MLAASRDLSTTLMIMSKMSINDNETILPIKTTIAQNEVPLSYHRIHWLYFLVGAFAVII